MQVYKVTIGSGATPIVPQDLVIQRNVPFQTLVFGAAAHTYYIGDSNVSSTNGVAVPVASVPLVIPANYALTQNLNGWYVSGTANDVVTVLVLE